MMKIKKILESGFSLKENNNLKAIKSPYYNYVFSKKSGFFARWGKTKEDDPEFSFFGPEILDCEITTSCNGINGKLCKFCYKGNTPNGKNMSFNTFKNVLSRFPRVKGKHVLTQIAFGADSECKSNPDIWKMMGHCRKVGVIPNITVSNVSNKTADKLAYYCGAVAVSRYDDKNVCYNSVAKLCRSGCKQINIHVMLSKETLDWAWETMRDRVSDKRLASLNAVVFLSLKPKGRGVKYHAVSQKDFKKLVDFALNNRVDIGFDSCSASKFLKSVKSHKDFKRFEMFTEPCESGIFSSYVNVEGKYFPCSFCEGQKGIEGIDLTKKVDFFKNLWYSDSVKSWRRRLLGNIDKRAGCRSCPVFKV